MKKILFILLLISGYAQAQLPPVSGFTNINQKYQWYGVKPPPDTTFSKHGFATKGDSVYWGNGTYYKLLSTGVTTIDTTPLLQKRDSTIYYPYASNPRGYLQASDLSQENRVLSGGIITKVTGLTINVSPTTVVYSNLVASWPSTNFTLATADATNDRYDAVYIDETGPHVATGTPGNPAVFADTPDPSDILLGYVYVPALATDLTTTGILMIRDEGAGGEWTISKTLTSTDNYGTNPYQAGSISQRITAATNNQYLRWTSPDGVKSKLNYQSLVIPIRLNATFANARNFIVRLMRSGVQVVGSTSITLTPFRGFTKTLLNTYQIVVISMPDFGGQDAFDAVQIINTGTGGTVDVQIDKIQLQSGSATVTPPATVVKQVFFSTVADLRAYSGSTDVQATTQGYYAANDGGGASYYWDGTSTAADDGGLTIKATSVPTGRWKLQFGSILNIKWFGAKADSTTDARPAFKLALAAATRIPLDAIGTTGGRATILIPRGKYAFSDSVTIRSTVNIIGDGAGTYPYQESQLIFAGGRPGFYLLQSSNGSGARQTIIKDIFMKSAVSTNFQNRHGIFTNTGIHLENVAVYNFSGDGIIVDTRDSGNANNSVMIHCHADYNRRYGFSFWGNDANNCNLIGLDANANGGSNIHDQSFLGNQYYGVHSSYAGIRQPNNLSYVNVSSVIYGALQPSTGIQPGVTSGWQDYWLQQNNLPLGWTTTWSADSTYFDAAAIWIGGSSNAGTTFGSYEEGGQLPVVLGPFGTMLFGDNGVGIASQTNAAAPLALTNDQNRLKISSALIVRNKFDADAYTSIDDGNGLNIAHTLGGVVEWRAFAGFGDTTARIYANSSLQPTLSFPLKNLTFHSEFGKDTVPAAVPIVGFTGIYLSDNNNSSYTFNKKRMISGGSEPPSGVSRAYAVGDFIFNNGSSADTLGWRCTTAGRPGTWTAVVASGSYPYVFTSPAEGQIVAFDASLNLVNINLGDIGDVSTSQLADTAAAIRADFPTGGSSLFPLTGTGTATGSVTGDLAANAFNIINTTYTGGLFEINGSGRIRIGDVGNTVNSIRLTIDDGDGSISVALGSVGVFVTSSLADTSNYIPASYVAKAYVDDHIANAGGGASGITINSTAITGGTTNYVLFQKSDGTVTQNSNLQFDPTTGSLNGYLASFNSGGFQFNGAGAALNNNYIQLYNSSYVKGYLEPIKLLRSTTNAGAAASLVVDDDGAGGIPGTYHIADFKITTSLRSFIDQSGALGLMNTAQPSGALTNGGYVYAQDVSSSAEIFVRDEANNSTQISPHNFTGIPQGRSNSKAWAFYSEKDGKYINVDMFRVVELLEKLTGEKLIFTGDVNNKPNENNK